MATTNTTRIVNLSAQVLYAPQPSQLQQSGAVVSVGGTTLTAGSYQFCANATALPAILSTAGNYAELNNMADTFVAQGNQVGFYVLELGVNADVVTQINSLQTWITANPKVFYAYLTPADWDIDGEEVGSITYPANTATYTTAPTVTIAAPTGTGGVQATATAQINTSGALTGITITNPGYYPDQIAPTATLSAATTGTSPTLTVNLVNEFAIMANNYAGPTAKTYFFGTTTSQTITNYLTQSGSPGSGPKSLFMTCVSPVAPSSEFTAAMPFYRWLVNNPGPAQNLQPMAFQFAYGVTPWPASGYSTEIDTILTNYGNIIGTGAEGGIPTACLFKGKTMDGEQAQFWYGADWAQIQSQQAVTAAVINGSNSQPPLIYDQHGINTLQSVAQGVLNTGVKYKCILSGTVTATPFYTYVTDNPANYKAEIYGGMSASITGIAGFLEIDYTMTISEFVA